MAPESGIGGKNGTAIGEVSEVVHGVKKQPVENMRCLWPKCNNTLQKLIKRFSITEVKFKILMFKLN